MRKPPDFAPPPRTNKTTPERIVMRRKYKLLTPLFGGGVEAGKVDTSFPVRGSTIRGQLRFWWRATCGGRFGRDGKAAMNKAEGELWGSTKRGSRVELAIKEFNTGSMFPVRDRDGRPTGVGEIGSSYSYVAFPLRQTDQKPAGNVQQDVTFTLSISFPADDEKLLFDLQAALWAWETFGGVGARTRRGFGALHCTGVSAGPGSAPFDKADWQWEYDCRAEAQLRSYIAKFVVEGYGPDYMTKLSRNQRWYVVTGVEADPISVWRSLFKALNAFRQDRDLDNRDRPFGRSHWPEPDAIRDITGQKAPAHARPQHGRYIRRFPRAAFGLPIIFEFKDGAADALTTSQDPRKTILTGTTYERMASPIILRPLACRGGQYVGLALILDSPRFPQDGLALKEKDSKTTIVTKPNPQLGQRDAADISTLHTSGSISTDVLQSFLNGLKKEIK